MLKPEQVEVLRDRTLAMLADVGLRVESDELVQIMLARAAPSISDRPRAHSRRLVHELVARLAPHQWLDDDDQSLHPAAALTGRTG